MPIIGTAGHVDHGKSTLVQALTGMDPDRLAEEKRRGMTIDLGFAHMDLPSGLRVGIVDVPGHARFLHNMLAGVHGMDAVLLVVAADEGVMPQTREHLDIVQLLGVTRLVVALTKIDLVDDEMQQLARADVMVELGHRRIDAEVIAVSAPRGNGLDALVLALTHLVGDAPTVDRGRPRLPVDRAFTMTGFGTVVTGSLVDGPLRVGQQLELLPVGAARARQVRVRGLQQHGHAVTEARPGSRVAANLQGIDHLDVHRGQVLAPPGTLRTTTRFDARVSVLEGTSGLRPDSRVRVHSGTAEVAARLIVLGERVLEAGAQGWVQLRLAAPLALRDGDRLVLRRLSPSETLAGGEVVDGAAPAHRGADAARVIAALSERTDLRRRVLQELARDRQGLTPAALAVKLAEEPAAVEAALAQLLAGGDAVLVGGSHWDLGRWAELVRRSRLEIDAFHKRHPLRPGMATEELRGKLGLENRLTAAAVTTMESQGLLERRARGTVAIAGWRPTLTEAQQRAVASIGRTLAASPLAPPRLGELGVGAEDLCQYLEDEGRVVRIGADIYLLSEAVDTARDLLVAHLREQQSITVSEARDVLGSSRKVVVPLLEYFDAAHLTVRDGDTRRLRGDSGPSDPKAAAP
ncbi:MAG: selenocysteine-specific translation elongation factor [Candidatus Dormibacteria bacterium]